jgi:hypothetical protein
VAGILEVTRQGRLAAPIGRRGAGSLLL